MNQPNVIIVHGAYGYPEENWFDWLRCELAELGIECIVPAFPTPDNQDLSNWLSFFQLSCNHKIHARTILVGHSLGAAFILRWLEQYTDQVSAAILIGAFIGEVGVKKFDEINQSFFLSPFPLLILSGSHRS